MKDSKQQIFQLLIKCGILKTSFKEFVTFKSGRKSPIYFDFRECRQYWDLVDLLCTALDAGCIQGKDIEVIMGVYTGAAVFSETLRDRTRIPSAYVRPDHKIKNYGLGKIIEGASVTGKKVVVFEDVVSTGASILDDAKIIRDCAAKEILLRPIFSYCFKGTSDKFREEGFTYESLFTIHDFVSEFEKIVSAEEFEILENWVSENCE